MSARPAPKAAAGAAAALALALALAPLPARAEDPPRSFVWMPGPARAIARTSSASRDTPLFELAYGPRAQASIGGEFGVAAFMGTASSLRLGMYAMVALENAVAEEIFPPHELWRGLIGFSAALSADALARRWLGPRGALEVGLVLGHESDHTDGYQERPRPYDIPFGAGGDFIAPDLAARLPLGARSEVVVRLQDRIYVRGDALEQAPGTDIVLRIRVTPHVQPVLALFAEQLLALDQDVRNAYFARVLAGPALVGRVGEVTPFVSFDVGAGKGLLVNHREARMSVGVRYAPF